MDNLSSCSSSSLGCREEERSKKKRKKLKKKKQKKASKDKDIDNDLLLDAIFNNTTDSGLQVTTITRPGITVGTAAPVVREGKGHPPAASTLDKVSAKNQKLCHKIEKRSHKISKIREKIDRDTSSRRAKNNSNSSHSDTSSERSSSADSNRKNKLFSSSVRTKRKLAQQNYVNKIGEEEYKPALENIEMVVKNRSSTSSDDEIIQKLKHKQRNAGKEFKDGRNVLADNRIAGSSIRGAANVTDGNHFLSSRRKKTSPEYARVSSTSFVQNYIPAVCEPSVTSSNHKGAGVINQSQNHGYTLNDSSGRHQSRKTSPERKTMTETTEKSWKTGSSKLKDEKKRESSSVEKRSVDKTSGDNFYGFKRAKRDASLERRIELNKDSSRRLLKNEKLRGDKKKSPERTRASEKKTSRDRTRKDSSRRRKSGVSVSRKNERKMRKRSRSRGSRRKRSRSSSGKSDELKKSDVFSKKIQPREIVKKKRKRGARESEDDDEPTFKSKKITLTVLPEKTSAVPTSVSTQSVQKEKSEAVQKICSPQRIESVENEQKLKVSSEVKSEVKSPPAESGILVHETSAEVEKTKNSSYNEEKAEIKTDATDEAIESCGLEEKSSLRERLKPLLEKKDLNPILPEVPFKSVKIDVKPETSVVLNSVPASSATEKDRKPFSISIKPSTATSPAIKKNLALSNFLSTARKELSSSKPEIIIPPKEKRFTKEGRDKVSDEDSSSGEETESPVVYQGCANIAKDEVDEELSNAKIGSLSFVLNSLKPPPPVSAYFPSESKDEVSNLSALENEQSDEKKVEVQENDSAHKFMPVGGSPPPCVDGKRELETNDEGNFEQNENMENQEDNYNIGNQEEPEDASDSQEVEDIVYYCPQAEEFLKSGLTEDVVLEIDQLYADGFLSDPLPSDVIENLNKLSEELSLFIMQQFRDSDFSKVRNNGLFFKGKIKLALMKGDSLLNGSTSRAMPAKEIALQKAKLFSNNKEVIVQNENNSICNSKLPSLEPICVKTVPQQSISTFSSCETQTSEIKEIKETDTKSVSKSASSKASNVFSNLPNSPKLKLDDSTETIQNVEKVLASSSETVEHIQKPESEFKDDVFSVQKPVKTDSEVSENKGPASSLGDAAFDVSPTPKSTTDLSLSVEASSKVNASANVAPFAKLGSKAVKAKPELTELREKKVGSTRERAQKFNDEVAVLNQILFCGAGPSNYVPHQEGQYTPTKVNPDYHKLQHIIQVTQYNFDNVSNPFVRCFGPPVDWEGPPPGQDCKLFVGKLPCDVFEDDLIPVFFEAGNVYEVRVLVDEVTGLNKGFCFVTMCTRIETDRAIKLLHGRLIKPRHKIIVRREVKFNQLFIGNLLTEKTEEQIAEAFSKLYSGITEIDLVYKGKDCGNSGFCILTFESFEVARDVRDVIQSNPIPIEDWDNYREYCADWAIPNEVLHDKKQEASSAILVKHLKLNTSEQELREHFSSYGRILKVLVQSYHAYIVFESNKEAAAAVKQLTTKGLHAKITEQDPEELEFVAENRLYGRRSSSIGPDTEDVNNMGGANCAVPPPNQPPFLNRAVATNRGTGAYQLNSPHTHFRHRGSAPTQAAGRFMFPQMQMGSSRFMGSRQDIAVGSPQFCGTSNLRQRGGILSSPNVMNNMGGVRSSSMMAPPYSQRSSSQRNFQPIYHAQSHQPYRSIAIRAPSSALNSINRTAPTQSAPRSRRPVHASGGHARFPSRNLPLLPRGIKPVTDF